MPRFVVKLAAEKYVVWSTVVDAPTTNTMTRQAMAEYLTKFEGQSEMEVEQRLTRADQWGTSARDVITVSEMIQGNRAGPGETELTKEQIIEKYSEGEENYDA